MRNRILLFICLGSASLSLCVNHSIDGDLTTIGNQENVASKSLAFQPDSSINSRVFLHNPASMEQTLGGVFSDRNKDADLTDVYVRCKEGNQYLRLVFFPGNETNSISQFEVGYLKNLPDSIIKFPCSLKSFITESKISLGITRQELINIKGQIFEEKRESNGRLIIRYVIDDFKTSAFLKRYNMPLYFADYLIENEKVIKFKFGFEYP